MNYDISIVGCGPVGATLANLLADFGYAVAIFEKEMEVYRAPRAVHIDDEVIRIFQAVGILEEIKDSIVPFEKNAICICERESFSRSRFTFRLSTLWTCPCQLVFATYFRREIKNAISKK